VSAPEFHLRPIPAAGLPGVRKFINSCLSEGLPPGIELDWLGPQDLLKPVEPGVRIFIVRLGLPPGALHGNDLLLAVAVKEAPATRCVPVPRETLLGWAQGIDYGSMETERSGDELRSRRLTRLDQRELGEDLIAEALKGYADSKAIRDLVENPRTWAPIGLDAVMEGEYIGVHIFPDGRRVGITVEFDQ
jgi:hypothetical protein